MNEQNKKIWRSVWFWVPFIILMVYGTYTAISYWIPYIDWKLAERRIEQLQNLPKCGEGDQECLLNNWNKMKTIFARNAEIYVPLYEVKKSKEVIDAMKHHDGTVCFMMNAPAEELSDDELSDWLNKFGAERFQNLAGFFLRARGVYEERYHSPVPRKVLINTLFKLRWKHFPFSKTWRTYNTAAHFLTWTPPDAPRVKIPDDILNEAMLQFIEHGEYFTDRNLLRLVNIARGKTGAE